MKINNEVVLRYTKLCPTSTSKCESFFDIEYKIIRHIRLGKTIELKDGGNTLIVRYHDLNFTIINNKVVEMSRDRSRKEVKVSEGVKYQYDKIHSKLVV